VNGKTRQYFVVLPNGFDNSKPAPVVFTFSGRGGTAAQLLPTGSGGSGFFAALLGVQPGFPSAIYVVPQALDSSGSSTGTDYAFLNTNGQDINFVKAMIASIEPSLCVDKSRYFADGVSQGAIMSELIACQLPNLFRGIGSIAGALGNTPCVAKPIAAWITHGDADTSVSFNEDVMGRDTFIKDNGCDTTNTQAIQLVDTIPVGDAATTGVTCTAYSQCTAGSYPVVWCPVHGEGHAVPSFAGTEIAKFFAQF
jgi:poly(3-hydroxybutyrate) depolymerase